MQYQWLWVVAAALAARGAGSDGAAALGAGGACSCAADELLDKDCCACTVSQVAQATSDYFKDLLVELVETPLFRVYVPYPEYPSKELYDVECSLPEFHEVAEEISAHQLGCAIQQCGCAEAECGAEHWRQQPCFVGCEADAKRRAERVNTLLQTPPLSSDSTGAVQYDLLDNPEQFTGYGTLLDDRSARMIWESLYTERFCFTSCPAETEAELKPEKRLVFRVVSGLQASINTHLAMHYGLFSDSGVPATRENWGVSRDLSFGPWKELFFERVGRHPDRMRNMHFVFALLTRALHRLEPHLDSVLEAGRGVCPKCAAHHNRTRDLMQQLVAPPEHAPEECNAVLKAFDYEALFAGQDAEGLKAEVKTRFRRMGELMTCVGCDRCKLWGTLQFHAARVAVGILLAEGGGPPDTADDAGGGAGSRSQFVVPSWSDLRPNDIVALVNALAQVSKSIHQAKQWTAMMAEEVEAPRAEL